jgi:hypothetical protein
MLTTLWIFSGGSSRADLPPLLHSPHGTLIGTCAHGGKVFD